MRYLLILFAMTLSLLARENPFFPSREGTVGETTNIEMPQIPLKRASLKLPSTARTVESVTISYKNLDGTIRQKTVELQNSIDWHLPIFISQNYNTSSAPCTKVTEKKRRVVAKLPFIVFSVDKKEIVLQTKDEMLRSFLLVRPHRIVCDFKRDIDMRSFEKRVAKSDLVKIRVGAHRGYYRVVLELDGSYRYKLKKVKEGYAYTLH